MEEKLKDVDTYDDLIEQFKHLDKEHLAKFLTRFSSST